MLNLLIFLPFVSAIIGLMLKKNEAKFFAQLVSLVMVAICLLLVFNYQGGLAYEFASVSFFPTAYHVGVNFIAILLMLLCAIMMFLSFIFFDYEDKSIIIASLLMLSCMMGLFAALDALLFYVFWEFSLVPLIYISARYSDDFKMGVKFFIYAFAGSIFMLLAILYISYLYYASLGIWTFDLNYWYTHDIDIPFNTQVVLFIAFFIAFAIKCPIFPFHTWAPKLYSKSPAVVSIMLVSFKMAPFGFIRFNLLMTPEASIYFSKVIMILALITVVYAAIIAFKAKDLKELIAYSSISHMGVITLGVFSFNTIGLSGAVFYMFAHGIVTGGLFMAANVLKTNYGTTQISHFHSLAKKMPGYSLLFAIILFSAVSLPLTMSFVGEFLILQGIAKLNLIYAFFAGLIIILGAIYMLNIFRNMFFSEGSSTLESFKLKSKEIFGLVIIVFFIFYLGIFPSKTLDKINSNSSVVLQNMKTKINDNLALNLLIGLEEEIHGK